MRLFVMLLVGGLFMSFMGCAAVNKKVESEVVPTQAQAVATMEAAKAVEKYAVELGDCLWTIAALKYHDAFMWPEIYHANRDQISNPDIIEVGQVLTIPRDGSLRQAARDEASAWPPYRAKHKHKR